MNHCSSCGKEFIYWEVWFSYWKALKIKCPSCSNRNSANIFVRFLLPIAVNVPGVFVFFWLRDTWASFNVIYGLLLFILLGYLFSLFVPLFKFYGK